MGWLFSHSSRTELITTLIDHQKGKQGERQTLRHTLRGNVLWSVVRFTALQDGFLGLSQGQSICLLLCDLLQKSGTSWGYKSLSEHDGPHYFSCPLSYLSLTTEVSPDWREQVRRYHATRAVTRRKNA